MASRLLWGLRGLNPDLTGSLCFDIWQDTLLLLWFSLLTKVNYQERGVWVWDLAGSLCCDLRQNTLLPLWLSPLKSINGYKWTIGILGKLQFGYLWWTGTIKGNWPYSLRLLGNWNKLQQGWPLGSTLLTLLSPCWVATLLCFSKEQCFKRNMKEL